MKSQEIRAELAPPEPEVATSAQDLGRLFMTFLAAGDLDGLVSLYEPEATFHPEPGRLVAGSDAIRTALASTSSCVHRSRIIVSGWPTAG